MCYADKSHGGKLTLTKSIKKNYKLITKPLVEVKSAFIATCADIDRYIRVKTGCCIREEMDEATVNELKKIYPYLSELTIEQWNRLILVFLNIRNDNAHLYQNKPVFIDADILAYLTALVEPEMTVVADGNELTIYGAYYVLTFLSQKFQLATFAFSLLNSKNFYDMTSKNLNAFAVNSQHLLQNFCGIGRPVQGDGGPCVSKFTFINDTLRRELTSVFLGLEAVAIPRKTAVEYSFSFRSTLSHIGEIEKDGNLYNRLVELRNTWFHGHWLDDEVTLPDGQKKRFDFYETIEILRMLRESLKDFERYDAVTGQIESFGKALLDFKALRLVEVSYKLLDKRLLTASKLEGRIENILNAYRTFVSTEERFFQAASSLLGKEPVIWKVSAAKFSNADSFPRKTVTNELRIIVFENDGGFDIGECHTNSQSLVLCDIAIPLEFCNLINGKKLKDYKLALAKGICDKIKVYYAE